MLSLIDKTIQKAWKYGKLIGRNDIIEVYFIPLYQEYWVFSGYNFIIKAFKYRDIKPYIE